MEILADQQVTNVEHGLDDALYVGTVEHGSAHITVVHGNGGTSLAVRLDLEAIGELARQLAIGNAERRGPDWPADIAAKAIQDFVYYSSQLAGVRVADGEQVA